MLGRVTGGSRWADVESFSTEQRASLARYAAAELERTDDADLLLEAIVADGKQRLTDTLPQVLAHADHDDPDIREAVAVAVGSLRDDPMPDDAVAALVRLARDPVDDVRDWALFSLGGGRVDPEN